MNLSITYDNSNSDHLIAARLFQKHNRRYELVETKDADVEVVIQTDDGLDPESYQIEKTGNKIYLTGGNRIGLLHGIGRILHRNPDRIKNEYRIPQKELRGIYFATHFYNYYHVAPVEEINDYFEELVLWGCNCVIVWFDMHHFSSIRDKEAVELLERIKSIFTAAKALGAKVYLGTIANEYYYGASKELLATNAIEGTEYFRKPIGYYYTELCPSNPEAKELLIASHKEVIEYFSDIALDYISLGPYDQGGCTCAKCSPAGHPWGSSGYLKLAKELTAEFRKICPDTRIVLNTWRFDAFVPGEWDGFLEDFDRSEKFYDFLMADLESPEVPEEFYQKAKEAGIGVLGFPEISMLSAVPWGGFGAVPVPDFVESSYKRTEMHIAGGTAYSEGIFEDINKVILLAMYFGGETIPEILSDYIGYYFSDEVVEPGIELIKYLETNLARHRINEKGEAEDYPEASTPDYSPIFRIKNTENIERALQLAEEIRDKLPPDRQESSRFRMLYLRTVIDKALKDNDGQLSDITETAAQELEKMYYADRAEYAVSPILKKVMKSVNGHI